MRVRAIDAILRLDGVREEEQHKLHKLSALMRIDVDIDGKVWCPNSVGSFSAATLSQLSLPGHGTCMAENQHVLTHPG